MSVYGRRGGGGGGYHRPVIPTSLTGNAPASDVAAVSALQPYVNKTAVAEDPFGDEGDIGALLLAKPEPAFRMTSGPVGLYFEQQQRLQQQQQQQQQQPKKPAEAQSTSTQPVTPSQTPPHTPAPPLPSVRRRLDFTPPKQVVPANCGVTDEQRREWTTRQFESGIVVASASLPATQDVHLEDIDTSDNEKCDSASAPSAPKRALTPLKFERVATTSTPTKPPVTSLSTALFDENSMDLDSLKFRHPEPSPVSRIGEHEWDVASMTRLLDQAFERESGEKLLNDLFLPVVMLLVQRELPLEREAIQKRFDTNAVIDDYGWRQHNMFVLTCIHKFPLERNNAVRPYLHSQVVDLATVFGSTQMNATALSNMFRQIITHVNSPGSVASLRLHMDACKLLDAIANDGSSNGTNREDVAEALIRESEFGNRCALAPWLSIDTQTAYELHWTFAAAPAPPPSVIDEPPQEIVMLVHRATADLVMGAYYAAAIHLIILQKIKAFMGELQKAHPQYRRLNDIEKDSSAMLRLKQIASEFLTHYRIAWERVGPGLAERYTLFVAPREFVQMCYLASEELKSAASSTKNKQARS